jgi:hypothetical protein
LVIATPGFIRVIAPISVTGIGRCAEVTAAVVIVFAFPVVLITETTSGAACVGVTRTAIYITAIVCAVELVRTRVGDVHLVTTSEPGSSTVGIAVILCTPVGVIAIQLGSSTNLGTIRNHNVVTKTAAITVNKPYPVSRFNIQIVGVHCGHLALTQCTEVILCMDHDSSRILHVSACGEILRISHFVVCAVPNDILQREVFLVLQSVASWCHACVRVSTSVRIVARVSSNFTWIWTWIIAVVWTPVSIGVHSVGQINLQRRVYKDKHVTDVDAAVAVQVAHPPVF